MMVKPTGISEVPGGPHFQELLLLVSGNMTGWKIVFVKRGYICSNCCFSIGDTSLNGCCSIVMLVLGGVVWRTKPTTWHTKHPWIFRWLFRLDDEPLFVTMEKLVFHHVRPLKDMVGFTVPCSNISHQASSAKFLECHLSKLFKMPPINYGTISQDIGRFY